MSAGFYSLKLMSKPLQNKTALVTGGTRGIGEAIVRRLAADGAHIAFTYAKSSAAAQKLADELSKAHGIKIKAYASDATNPANMATLAASVLKDFDSVDILVNNAGIFTAMGAVGEISPTEFEELYAVNVRSTFHLTNALAAKMKKGSRIINIGSCLGERAIGAGMSVYNSSKFAIAGLTRSWAHDLAPRGILVNAVQPGNTNTDMNPDEGEFAEGRKKTIPLGRYGTPAEIAGAVAFFAGADSSYITGETLTVDGGVNA